MNSAEYLDVQLFDDGDASIRHFSKEIVVTRTEHQCMGAYVVNASPHQIPVGSKAVRERAIVEGSWGTSYCCLTCIEKFVAERKSA